MAIARRHQRAAPGGVRWQTWLRRHRAGYLVHRRVGGLAAMLPLPAGDPLQLAVPTMVIMGVTAVAFTMTAFDAVAAFCFGGPRPCAAAL